ncbi:MAG: NAD-dependent epimerase/dehydratase family protein [Ruminococcus sp.]|nr:NAD-dependent epimerase/dehydratase family protein [Ruminococcus sp.]
MRLLVTGGTVFVSRYTAEYFAGKGHEVYVLNRGSRPQSGNVAHIKADRRALGNALKDMRFDAVLDVTAYMPEDVSCLLDGLGSFGDYILVSSSAVYPETLPQPFSEEQECGRNTVWGDYGTDKLAAEKLLHSRFPGAYILRPPYLYGPMDNLYREAFVFECAEKVLPFYVPKDGSMPLQFCHVRDLCRFMEALLIKKPEQRIYNTGNTCPVDINEWVRLCYAALGKAPEIRYVSADVPQRSYFPFYDYGYVLDVSAQNRLISDLTPLSQGLREAYEWYRSNRELVRKKPLLEYIKSNF